jgi:V8-like Glu-specific endopeptidase
MESSLLSQKYSALEIRQQFGIKKKMDFISKEKINDYPHNAILSVESEFMIGKETRRRSGTCFLIGDGFALTSAHVVFHKGTEAHEVTVYPGLHGDNFISLRMFHSSYKVIKFVYSSSYQSNDEEYELNEKVELNEQDELKEKRERRENAEKKYW